jgi:hypothetical protein
VRSPARTARRAPEAQLLRSWRPPPGPRRSPGGPQKTVSGTPVEVVREEARAIALPGAGGTPWEVAAWRSQNLSPRVVEDYFPWLSANICLHTAVGHATCLYFFGGGGTHVFIFVLILVFVFVRSLLY